MGRCTASNSAKPKPHGLAPPRAPVPLPKAPTLLGIRNWDYRYCWLRDSAFTLYALAVLGCGGEGRRFSEFLARVAISYPDLQIMYGIDADTELDEKILDHLSGYRASRPVRVGNAAYRQRQIDVYGEVLDWAYLYRRLGGMLDAKGRRLLNALADFVAANWREPDAGLWEMRAEPRQHVHGKIMSWVALDRALRLLGGNPLWERERDAIAADVREHGVDRRSAALVQAYGELLKRQHLGRMAKARDSRFCRSGSAAETATRRKPA